MPRSKKKTILTVNIGPTSNYSKLIKKELMKKRLEKESPLTIGITQVMKLPMRANSNNKLSLKLPVQVITDNKDQHQLKL